MFQIASIHFMNLITGFIWLLQCKINGDNRNDEVIVHNDYEDWTTHIQTTGCGEGGINEMLDKTLH